MSLIASIPQHGKAWRKAVDLNHCARGCAERGDLTRNLPYNIISSMPYHMSPRLSQCHTARCATCISQKVHAMKRPPSSLRCCSHMELAAIKQLSRLKRHEERLWLSVIDMTYNMPYNIVFIPMLGIEK